MSGAPPSEEKEIGRPATSKDGAGQHAIRSSSQPVTMVHGRDGWLDLPKTLAYVDGMVLYSVSVHVHLDGWRAILKAKRRGKFYVAFVNAEAWSECLDTVLHWAETGTLSWWDDKYPPK